jgi:hypothetical protein
MRRDRVRLFLASAAPGVLAALFTAGTALAVPGGPAETSLDKCQNALRTEGVKHVQATQKAIAICLGKISTEKIKKETSVAGALSACTSQFHKLGRSDGKSVGDNFSKRVALRCTPGGANAHTLDDVLGTGSPGVAHPLNVSQQLDALCSHFGGDGSIDSVAEWIACMREANHCTVLSEIATQFPRAIEWLNELAAAMPPSDARNAVVSAEMLLDGATDDGVPNFQCGSN